jgi:hypothetical protein
LASLDDVLNHLDAAEEGIALKNDFHRSLQMSWGKKQRIVVGGVAGAVDR